MDGWVTIGTKLDSKQLEKDLKNAEKKLEQYERESEKLTEKKAKVELDLQEYEKQKAIIKQTTELNMKFASTEAGKQKVINEENQAMSELNNKYSKQLNNLETINKKIKENANNQGLVKSEIEETNNKLKQARGFDNIKGSVDNIGKSVQGVTKKVARWALAFIGVRSAISLIRQSFSTLSQYDDQMATDVEYIRYAIANTLRPVVEFILNLVKQIMFYVGYIAKAWLGVNIYAKSSAKSFKDANKQSKEMGKQLAGFDEMNVLSDSSANNSGTPSFDLASPEDVPVPKWIQWIADNGDLVKAILFGIAGGLTAIHLGLTLIQALGIGLALAGIVITFQNIIKFLQNPSFENFIGILEGIALAVTGVAIAIGAWPVAIGAAIAFVIVEIVKHFDDIMKLFNNLIDWMDKNVLGALRFLFGPLGDILYAPISFFVNAAKGAFESFFGGIKQIVNGIVKLFKGDFKGGIADVFGGLKSIMLAPINALISGINSLIKGVNKISFKAPDWVPLIGGKKWGFSLPQIPKLAKGTILNNPGKGVPVAGGNAIAGEAGREAYLPLSDTQLLEELGSTIGRYITINLTNVTELDGRQIARKVDKIQQNNNFVFNR